MNMTKEKTTAIQGMLALQTLSMKKYNSMKPATVMKLARKVIRSPVKVLKLETVQNLITNIRLPQILNLVAEN